MKTTFFKNALMISLLIMVCFFNIMAQPPDMYWTGSMGDNWFEPNNWTPFGVPSRENKVIIPDELTDPVIVWDEAHAKSVSVQSGANLTLAFGGDLVLGDVSTYQDYLVYLSIGSSSTVTVNVESSVTIHGGNPSLFNYGILVNHGIIEIIEPLCHVIDMQNSDLTNHGTIIVRRDNYPSCPDGVQEALICWNTNILNTGLMDIRFAGGFGNIKCYNSSNFDNANGQIYSDGIYISNSTLTNQACSVIGTSAGISEGGTAYIDNQGWMYVGGGLDISENSGTIYKPSGGIYSISINIGILHFTPPPIENTWEGDVSTDWHDCSNWSLGQLPHKYQKAIVPLSTNHPIMTKSALVSNVELQTNSFLSVEAGALMLIDGTFTPFPSDNGILTLGGSTMHVKSDGTLYIRDLNATAIEVNGQFTNEGPLKIQYHYGRGIYVNDGTFSDIGGVIDIAETPFATGIQVGLDGTFIAQVGSQIFIKNAGGHGIENAGQVDIWDATIDMQNINLEGISNGAWATFNNHTGTITMDNVRMGIANYFSDYFQGGFFNSSGSETSISISNADSSGIYNEFDIFMNDLTIENAEAYGIDNRRNFTLNGNLSISNTQNIGINNVSYDLLNTANFFNNHGGIVVEIDLFPQNVGIWNADNAVFDNYDCSTIQCNGQIIDYFYSGIYNNGTIIETNADNSGILLNNGTILNYNGGTFTAATNNGTINDYTGDAPTDICWTGCADNNWHNPNNWLGNAVPQSFDKVVIQGFGSNPVVTDADAALRSLVIENGATLTLEDGIQVLIVGALNSGDDPAELRVGLGSTLTIGSTFPSDAAIFVTNASQGIINEGDLVNYGTLDISTFITPHNYGTMDNDGTIVINALENCLMGIENIGTINNNGQMEVTGGVLANVYLSEFGPDAGQFFNNTTGMLTLNQSLGNGISLNGSSVVQFQNDGTLYINNPSNRGILLSEGGNQFNNNGLLSIDGSGLNGISILCFSCPTPSTFTNTGRITIHNLGDSDNPTTNRAGIRLVGGAFNSTSGSIDIKNEGASVLSGVEEAIYGDTNCSINNSGCSLIIAEDRINIYSGTLTNSGNIIERSSDDSYIDQNTGTILNLNGGTFNIDFGTGRLIDYSPNYLFDIVWTGCTSTNWHEPNNWHTGTLPLEDDLVLILPEVNCQVFDEDITARMVWLEGDAHLSLSNDNTLTVNGTGTAATDGIRIRNESRIWVNPGSAIHVNNADDDGIDIRDNSFLFNQGFVVINGTAEAGIYLKKWCSFYQ